MMRLLPEIGSMREAAPSSRSAGDQIPRSETLAIAETPRRSRPDMDCSELLARKRAEVARMRTSEECTAKALELDARALEFPLGSMREGYMEMAAHWRQLAVSATAQDLSNVGGPSASKPWLG